MPTGYTADLYEGKAVTFPEFAMNCARAFGALVDLRDNPSAPIPVEIEPSSYYRDRVIRASEDLDRIAAWSLAEAETQQNRADEEAREIERRSEAEAKARRARYEAMLVEVRAWEPPTPDHVNLRDFMIQQLSDSIEHDCYIYRPDRPQMTPAEYKAHQLDRATREYKRAQQALAEEVARCEGRTNWLRALRDSLPQVAPSS